MAGCNLTGLRLFEWNEKPSKSNVPIHQGLFLFVVRDKDDAKKKMKVIDFDVLKLRYQWPQACHCIARKAVQDSGFFEPSAVRVVSNEISEYLTTRYLFSTAVISFHRHQPPCIVIVAYVTRDAIPHDRNESNSSILPASWAFRPAMGQVVFPLSGDRQVYRTYSDGDDGLEEAEDSSSVDEYSSGSDNDGDYNSDSDELDADSQNADGHDRGVNIDATEGDRMGNEEFDELVGVLRSWRGMCMRDPVVPLCNCLPVGFILVVPLIKIVTLSAKSDGKPVSLWEDCCSICLDEFHEGMNVASTVCDHVFHKNCIFKWLGNSMMTCPYCRTRCVKIV